MFTEEEISEFRADALERMTSRVTVRRKTGRTVVVDRLNVPEWVDVHLDLPFRLDGGSTGDGGSRAVTIGGVTYETATALGHMPATTQDLRDDDHLLISRGEWAGSVYRIVKAVKKDQATARRVPIVEVDAPKEWAA